MPNSIILIFFIWLQIVPPPPPPGGSELQSIIVVDELGNETDISNSEFKDFRDGLTACLYGTNYCSFRSIMDSLYTGALRVNRRNDLKRLWDIASTLDEKLEVINDYYLKD